MLGCGSGVNDTDGGRDDDDDVIGNAPGVEP
jgi:hypothetical protein